MSYNVPNTRERIAARRRARRSQGGSRVRPGLQRRMAESVASGRLAGLVIFAMAAAALAYLLNSPRFTVGQISVVGQQALKADEIAELADLAGQPVWYADTEAAVERLLANAYIERASVSLALPDQAQITIVERRPDVRWQVGGVQYLVDSGGKVLGPAQAPAIDNVLVVAASGTTLSANDTVDIDALQLARTLAVRLPSELGLAPATIGWDYGLGVYIKTGGGQTVVFGQSEHLERKMQVLGFLLQDGTAFTYLDLRPSNPFYQNINSSPAPTPAP